MTVQCAFYNAPVSRKTLHIDQTDRVACNQTALTGIKAAIQSDLCSCVRMYLPAAMVRDGWCSQIKVQYLERFML